MSAVVRINRRSAMHVQIRYMQIKQRHPRWISGELLPCWDNHENSSTSTNYNIERYIGVIDSYKRFTSLQRREHKALISHFWHTTFRLLFLLFLDKSNINSVGFCRNADGAVCKDDFTGLACTYVSAWKHEHTSTTRITNTTDDRTACTLWSCSLHRWQLGKKQLILHFRSPPDDVPQLVCVLWYSLLKLPSVMYFLT